VAVSSDTPRVFWASLSGALERKAVTTARHRRGQHVVILLKMKSGFATCDEALPHMSPWP
jgi:hypothetical protein